MSGHSPTQVLRQPCATPLFNQTLLDMSRKQIQKSMQGFCEWSLSLKTLQGSSVLQPVSACRSSLQLNKSPLCREISRCLSIYQLTRELFLFSADYESINFRQYLVQGKHISIPILPFLSPVFCQTRYTFTLLCLIIFIFCSGLVCRPSLFSVIV